MRTYFCMAVMAMALGQTVLSGAEVKPLLAAHAHNDYRHERPLLDALAHGFTSVEADVFLVGEKLCVAHDADEIRPERTLCSLYLDPLRECVRQNIGCVLPEGPQVTLLIDIKTEAEATYGALDNVLKQYKDILTIFGPNTQQNRMNTNNKLKFPAF